MSHYGEPCANDDLLFQQHGRAVVGIGMDTGDAKWVCMSCFENYLRQARDRIDRARAELFSPEQ